MKNEFAPYDLALAMKELGFDEKCIMHWRKGKLSYYLMGDNAPSHIPAPLYQQAFRFFRDKYKLFGELSLTTKQEDVEVFEFFVLNVNEPLFESDDYTVYEQAELACLKKLIEIVNQNKDDE
jgi:hypothetical protein